MPSVVDTIKLGQAQQNAMFEGLRQSLAAQAHEELATDQLHLNVVSEMAKQSHQKEALEVQKLHYANELNKSNERLNLYERAETRLTDAQRREDALNLIKNEASIGDRMFSDDLNGVDASIKNSADQIKAINTSLTRLYSLKNTGGRASIADFFADQEKGIEPDHAVSPTTIEGPDGGPLEVTGQTLKGHIERLEKELGEHQGKLKSDTEKREGITTKKKAWTKQLQENLRNSVTLRMGTFGHEGDPTLTSETESGIGKLGKLKPLSSVRVSKDVLKKLGGGPNTPRVLVDAMNGEVVSHVNIRDDGAEDQSVDIHIPDAEFAKGFEYNGRIVKLANLPPPPDAIDNSLFPSSDLPSSSNGNGGGESLLPPFSGPNGEDITDSVGPEGGGDVDEDNAFFQAFNDEEALDTFLALGSPRPTNAGVVVSAGVDYPKDRNPSHLTIAKKREAEKMLKMSDMPATAQSAQIDAIKMMGVSSKSLAEEALPELLAGGLSTFTGPDQWALASNKSPEDFKKDVIKTAADLKTELAKEVDALPVSVGQKKLLQNQILSAATETQRNLLGLWPESQTGILPPPPDAAKIAQATSPMSMESIQRNVQIALGAKLQPPAKSDSALAYALGVDPRYRGAALREQSDPFELFTSGGLSILDKKRRQTSQFHVKFQSFDPSGMIYGSVMGDSQLNKPVEELVVREDGTYKFKPEVRERVISLTRSATQAAWDIISGKSTSGRERAMKGDQSVGSEADINRAVQLAQVMAQTLDERMAGITKKTNWFGVPTDPMWSDKEFDIRPMTGSNFQTHLKQFPILFADRLEAMLPQLLTDNVPGS